MHVKIHVHEVHFVEHYNSGTINHSTIYFVEIHVF